jgi:dynein intermediate chain
MSDRRRAEIELKRAKLAELRKAREERKRNDDRGRSATSTPGYGTPADDRRDEERTGVNNLVTNLLGERVARRGDTTPGSSVPSTPGPNHTGLGLLAHGHPQTGTRSTSRLSDSGSEKGNQRNNTMVQVGGDAPDR